MNRVLHHRGKMETELEKPLHKVVKDCGKMDWDKLKDVVIPDGQYLWWKSGNEVILCQ